MCMVYKCVLPLGLSYPLTCILYCTEAWRLSETCNPTCLFLHLLPMLWGYIQKSLSRLVLSSFSLFSFRRFTILGLMFISVVDLKLISVYACDSLGFPGIFTEEACGYCGNTKKLLIPIIVILISTWTLGVFAYLYFISVNLNTIPNWAHLFLLLSWLVS